MLLDVESQGLHGVGFAWGYVVVDQSGSELDNGYAACIEALEWESVDDEDRQWLHLNVMPHLHQTHTSLREMRSAFWRRWLHWKQFGALLVADCAFPVETNFLTSCIAHEPQERKWQGPYPLIGVESILLAAGMNPLGEYGRIRDELPKHHPTCDARQSARLFREAQQRLQANPSTKEAQY